MDRFGLFSTVCILRDSTSRRHSSWDRSGGNEDWVVVPPGGTHILLEATGAGCVRHFYWTFVHDNGIGDARQLQVRLNVFRGFVLRAYWNGERAPSIEAPLGDFFGVANGQFRGIRSLAFTANTGARGVGDHATWGFNCYLPMPFTAGARIEIENQGTLAGRIWYHLDWESYGPGTPLPAGTGFLHASWRRENPTRAVTAPGGSNLTGEHNYVILDTRGSGQLAGYFLTVVNRQPTWWGEGDDMVFIDGEPFPPSIHGTGTEEIFGGGACPDEEYSGPYTGFHCIENRAGYRWFGTNGMYRFFISDPIRFRTALRVTLEHGHANDLSNEYSSVAFWYQDRVNPSIARLPPVAQRAIGPL